MRRLLLLSLLLVLFLSLSGMKKYNGTVITTVGNAVVGASVTVYNTGTTNKPTIYSTPGVTTANPLTTDSYGRYSFYVANGIYDLKVTKTTPAINYTLTGVEIFDVYSYMDQAVKTTSSPAFTGLSVGGYAFTVGGAPTLNNWFNQSVKTTASPSFAGLTVNGSVVTVSGAATLNNWFDQSVKTTSSPTFAGLTLSGLGDGIPKITSGVLAISNVEDTKLSTWAGSTNIITLGTVATGTIPKANVVGLTDADTPTFAGGYYSNLTDGYIPLYQTTGGISNSRFIQSATSNVDLLGVTTTGAELRLREAPNTGTSYIGLKAPDSVTTSVTYTLPEDSTAGYVLSTNGSGTLSWVAAADVISGIGMFANTGTGTVGSSATLYVNPASFAYSATENDVKAVVPWATVMRRMYIKTSDAQPANGTLVFTLRKNGVDTDIVVTIAAGASAAVFSDTVNTASFAAGDLVSLKVVNGSPDTTSATFTAISLSYDTSGTGMIDPMTAAGDIVIRNAGNNTTRLPKGNDSDVLTLVSGVPAWQAPGSGLTLGGADKDVQINVSGALGADSGVFYYNSTTHALTITTSVAGAMTPISIRNSSAGTGSYAQFNMGNDTAADQLYVRLNSSALTGAGGYSYLWSKANAPMLFGVNNTEVVRINPDITTNGNLKVTGGGTIIERPLLLLSGTNGDVPFYIPSSGYLGIGGNGIQAVALYVGGQARTSSLRIDRTSTGFYNTFATSASQASDLDYTLPIAQGVAGSPLVNNGSGSLYWGDGFFRLPSAAISAPTTGKGLEMGYASVADAGYIQSLDRDPATDTYKELRLVGHPIKIAGHLASGVLSYDTWPTTRTSGYLYNDGSGNLSWDTIAGDVGLSGSGTAGQMAYFSGLSSLASTNAHKYVACTGSADNVAIQAAINALPTSGGTVQIYGGNCAITSTLTIGNGSLSAPSTRNNVRLVGAGGKGSNASETTVTSGATTFTWGGSASGIILQINGPISGVSIEGITFNCNTSAATALNAIHPFNSSFSNLMAYLYTGTAYILTSYTEAGDTVIGANRNTWTNISAGNASGSSANGISIGPAAMGTSKNLDVAQNVFINCGFERSSNASAKSLILQFTDNISFYQCSFGATGGSLGTGVYVNPPTGVSGVSYPAAVLFYNSSIGGGTAVNGTWTPVEKIGFIPYPVGDGQPTPSAVGFWGWTTNAAAFNPS